MDLQSVESLGSISDGDSSSDGDAAGGPPCLVATSRSCPRLVRSVTDSFSEYKRFLIEEIEFGGMLFVPEIRKVDLKLSMWLMSRVNVEERCINLDKHRSIKFWPGDVHKIFGIPRGPRSIRGPDAVASEEAVEFMQDAIGMKDKGAHSLSAVEGFLRKEINEKSSSLQKDCFKIAAVIFFMGHVLSPSTKHDYATIDFWGAIRSADEISQYDWCELCLRTYSRRVRRFKMGSYRTHPRYTLLDVICSCRYSCLTTWISDS